MAKIQTQLQCSTVANMLATELKRRGIDTAEDEELKYNILTASADHLLNAGIANDIHECVNEIDEYINDSLVNYPNWFIAGEE